MRGQEELLFLKKNFCLIGSRALQGLGRKESKVFCFFFSKKKYLLFLADAAV
jgi:hypothetical protein